MKSEKILNILTCKGLLLQAENKARKHNAMFILIKLVFWDNMSALKSRFRYYLYFIVLIIALMIAFLLIQLRESPATSKTKNLDTSLQLDSVFASGVRLFYKNTDSARSLIATTLATVPDDYPVQQMRFMNFIGATYQVQDNYEQALEYYYKALMMAPEIRDSSLLVSLYNNIGYINQKTGNYKAALNFMLKALNSNNNNNTTASILNNIGIVYLSIEEYDKGEKYFREALTGSQLNNDSISMATLLTNLGFVYMNRNETDSARYYFSWSLKIAEKTENYYANVLAQNGLGDLFRQTKNYNMAEFHYVEGRKLAASINDTYSVAYSMMGLTKIKLENEQAASALELINEAFEIAQNIDNHLLIYECKQIYSDIYKQMGMFETSLKHLDEYITLKEKFINQNTIRQVYNEEISVLNEANRIKQLEIERQELQLRWKNMVSIFVVIVFVLSIFAGYFIFRNYRYRQNSKIQKLLISLNEKKSRAAIEAEIQERKRIGQDLHDGLGQMLSVARLNISALYQNGEVSKERQIELINSTLYSVDAAFREIREISHNLAPAILAVKGLEGATQELVRRFNESKKIRVTCELFGLTKNLDKLIESTLYRAVQELSNNAIKHSEANNISIQLVQNEKEITLMVEDDGTGFDSKQVTNSNIVGGIQNIQSRVENLHGTMFIDSTINRGSIITITIPLNQYRYGANEN